MPIVLRFGYSVGRDADGQPGMDSVVTALERAAVDFEDFSAKIWPAVVPVFEDAVEKQYETQGASGVRGPWQALSEEYAKWKAREAPGFGLLELSGRMRDGLTRTASPFALREFGKDSFNYGTAGVPYAGYHQTGTDVMASRPAVDFGPDVERSLARVAAKVMRESIQQPLEVDDDGFFAGGTSGAGDTLPAS